MNDSSEKPSGTQLLIDWANQQDSWVRSLAGEVLATRSRLSDASIQQARNLYLAEKQLSPEQLPSIEMLGGEAGTELPTEALRLLSLADVLGVNALAESQKLDFNPRMTLIFGENAAGKTGYVRVLKRVAAVRSAEPIIADIHRPAKNAPQATIRYQLGDAAAELRWTGEAGVGPLTRMSVFDTRAVALHLEDNLTYVYTPAELALFKHLHDAIERVRGLLESDLATKQRRPNPFLMAFARGTSIYPKIETLGANSNLAELERLAQMDDSERAQLEARRVSIQVLTSQSENGRAEMLRNRAAVMRGIITVGKAVIRFDTTAFLEARRAHTVARDQHAAAAARVFDGILPSGVGPAWQRFVEAGEAYLRAAGRAAYPLEDDRCIYCRQDLEKHSVDLLHAYRTYAAGTTATGVEDAGSVMARQARVVVNADIENAVTSLRASLPALTEGDHPPEWATDGIVLLEDIVALQEGVKEAKSDLPDLRPRVEALLGQVSKALSEADGTLAAVEGNAETRARRLEAERGQVRELEARITLGHYFADIRSFVQEAAWADKLRILLQRFQLVLKSLTEATKTASNDAMNPRLRTRLPRRVRGASGP
jgi:hypothetical protein